jgi:hypothetical protein
MTMNRCKKCGGMLVTWAIDNAGSPIYRCPTVLTSRGIDGQHGPFIECRSYYRNGQDITGNYVCIPVGGKYATVGCQS